MHSMFNKRPPTMRPLRARASLYIVRWYDLYSIRLRKHRFSFPSSNKNLPQMKTGS